MDGQRLLRSRAHRGAQTALLLASLTGVASLSGYLLLGVLGAVAVPLFAIIAVALGARLPAGATLRERGARRLSAWQAPELVSALGHLSRRAGLRRVPELYLVPSATPQALTVGNADAAAIGVTTGLLSHLSPREVVAVLGHELAHVRNGDTQLMAFASAMLRFARSATFVGGIILLVSVVAALLGAASASPAGWLALMASSAAAGLLLLAFSRTREYAADLGAVALTGDPRGLASALTKIEALARAPWFRVFGGSPPRVPELLRTHPSTRARVAKLLELRSTPQLGTLVPAVG